MDNQQHNAIVNIIWGIADDCQRDVYVRGKYRDVIRYEIAWTKPKNEETR